MPFTVLSDNHRAIPSPRDHAWGLGIILFRMVGWVTKSLRYIKWRYCGVETTKTIKSWRCFLFFMRTNFRTPKWWEIFRHQLPGTQLSAWCLLRWWKIARALMMTLGQCETPNALLRLWKSCWIRKIASSDEFFRNYRSSSSRVPTADFLPDIINNDLP